MLQENNNKPSSVLLTKLAQGSLVIAGVSLVGMVLVEGWQVLARYALNDSPSWTEPVALLLINTAMMFSAAVAVRRQTHFSFQVLVDIVPGAMQRILRGVAQLIIAIIGGLLAWRGALMVLDSWSIKVAGAQLQQGMMYLPMAFGGLLILVFAIEQLLVYLSSHDEDRA